MDKRTEVAIMRFPMALVIHSRRFKIYRKPSSEQTTLLEQELQDTGLLDNDFVLLVGGIALSLHAGDYYRLHSDIDLAIFEADIPRFCALAERNGYTIAERLATGHLSPLYDFSFVRPLPTERIITSKHTRVIRNLRPLMMADRSTFLDVFVYAPNGKFVEVPHYNLRFPNERVFPITQKTLPSGLTVNLPSPLHILDVKRSETRTVNTNDLQYYAHLEQAFGRQPSGLK